MGTAKDQQAEDEPPEPWQPWSKALQICSTAVTEYGLRSCWRQALELLQATREESIPPDILLYNRALQACRQGNDWQQTVQMLRSLRLQVGMRGDAVSYTTVLSSAASTAVSEHHESAAVSDNEPSTETRWPQALHVLQGLAQDGTRADGVLFLGAINACGQGQRWLPALVLLDDMRRKAQEVTGVTQGAAMAATARCNDDWPVVLRLFRDLRKRPKMVLDSVSFNAAFLATLLGGHPARAFRLLRAARRLNLVEPDASLAPRLPPVSPGKSSSEAGAAQLFSWTELTA